MSILALFVVLLVLVEPGPARAQEDQYLDQYQYQYQIPDQYQYQYQIPDQYQYKYQVPYQYQAPYQKQPRAKSTPAAQSDVCYSTTCTGSNQGLYIYHH